MEVDPDQAPDGLLNFSIKSHDKKNIREEVRAKKDITKFAEDEEAMIVLNSDESSALGIIDHFIDELKSKQEVSDDLMESIRSSFLTEEEVPQFTESIRASETENWLVATAEVPGLQKRSFGFVRLSTPSNIGNLPGGQLFFITATPPGLQRTKAATETGKSFASLLTDQELRLDLTNAATADDVRAAIATAIDRDPDLAANKWQQSDEDEDGKLVFSRRPLGGIWKDLERRMPWYFSDYLDGFRDFRTIGKVMASTLFLYFACILPAVTFGIVNDNNTEGAITVQKMMTAQVIGGLTFALVGGQPLTILLSTAPITIFVKIIYVLSTTLSMDFFTLYAWVGIFNGMFLVIYAVTEASVLMRYSTRFSEESFGFFISIAFSLDGLRPMVYNFMENFYSCGKNCNQGQSLDFFILTIGTAILGYKLWAVRYSSVLTPFLRELLSDYSLPLSVLVMSIIGSGIFYPVERVEFPNGDEPIFRIAYLFNIPFWGLLIALVLAFMLSLLFYIDGNISIAAVNNPNNKLKKGHAYHLDMYIVGVISVALSMLGLPYINPGLPHSPLHVRSLAEFETIYLKNGTVQERIVRVRETRMTALLAHILLGISVFMVPFPLDLIPIPVFYGVFLYLAITALPGSQFYQRLKLFITEKKRYPPNSYVRQVPTRVLHGFTLLQCCCIAVLCFFGFFPNDYLQIIFPVFILALLPFRHFVIPRIFKPQYVKVLDQRFLDQA